MALPTGNLTFHVDGSVVTDLWTVNTAGVYTVQSTDGGVVNYWDDVEHAANKVGAILGAAPIWRSTTPLMSLPCVGFNGSTQSLKICSNDGTTGVTTDTLIGTSAKTVLVAFYIEGGATNTTVAEENDGLLSNENGTFGMTVRNNSGAFTLYLHNYETGAAADSLIFSLAIDVSHVVYLRHNGTTMFGSLDGAAETSITTGTTAAFSSGDWLNIGKTWGGSTTRFNGRVGELASVQRELDRLYTHRCTQLFHGKMAR